VNEIGAFLVTAHTPDDAAGGGAPSASAPAHRPFSGALDEFARCVIEGSLDGHMHQSQLGAGVVRRTLAASTEADVPRALSSVAIDSCPALASAAGKLRAAVDATGRAYAALLDSLVSGEGDE
jgi:hypothetical protein